MSLAVLAVAFALSSPAFGPGAPIPREHTCDGADRSPPLSWTAPPRRTRSLALIVDDPDAPGGTFTHWLAWGIGPKARRLPAGKPAPVEGRNDSGKTGYLGPCPPGGRHRYVFRLYALDVKLTLPAGAGKPELQRALAGHVLAVAKLVGTYER